MLQGLEGLFVHDMSRMVEKSTPNIPKLLPHTYEVWCEGNVFNDSVLSTGERGVKNWKMLRMSWAAPKMHLKILYSLWPGVCVGGGGGGGVGTKVVLDVPYIL